MIHMDLQIAAADPREFVIEPMGERIDIFAGDRLAIEVEAPADGEPELVRGYGPDVPCSLPMKSTEVVEAQ